ncbi:pyrroloquinoline quinone precursor peptide PqqA, partial [Acinetobacter baumannii]
LRIGFEVTMYFEAR